MKNPPTTPRFYQKSLLLPTPADEKAVYQYGETELIILGQHFPFPSGTRTPHEIFHLFTLELSRKYDFPEYPLFSHADEITSDYLEEIFALATRRGDRLLFNLASIDRKVSAILDCTIVFLQLEPYHAEISQRTATAIPKYQGWRESRSPLLPDLQEYERSGILSSRLAWIETDYLQPLGDTWAKYFMAAHYAKQMLNLLLRDSEVVVRDKHLQATVQNRQNYLYEMYALTTVYKNALDLKKHPEAKFLEFSC